MTMTTTTVPIPDNTNCRIIGRKRCYPSRSRRTLRIASAVTFSASYLFVVAVAFQQSSLHINNHNPCHSQSQSSNSRYSRFSTAIRVMTDPNNLGVHIEKNIVTDRAALEELYILSSLAEIAKNSTAMDITTTNQTTKTLRKRRSLPGQVIVKSTTSAARGTTRTGKKKKLSSPTMFSNTNTNTNSRSNKNKSSVPRKEKRIFFTDNIDSTTIEGDKQQTQKQKQQQQEQPIISSVTNIQKFKGLSIGPPNPRNRKKKSLNNSNDSIIDNTKNFIPPSSGSGIGVTENNDDDEYIRNILRKKEESFIYDEKTEAERQQQLSASISSSSIVEEEEEEEEDILASTANTYTKSSSKFTSRSSTMPGFIERTNTNKLKAYRDGIKIAEQQSGEKVVDTAAAKKKRTQINGKEMYKTSVSVPDSLIQFANEIHEVDRITPKEEIDLGGKTQEAIRLQNIYDGLVANLHREPTDDEWCAAAGKFNMESISQSIEEGLEAKNILVTSNLRMVQGVVNVYIRNGLQGQYNAGDLMQEGILVSSCSRFCFV
ncbi:MAG: DNA-directed RNA polymerase sigma subunit (sigma70/sigma32) [Bacillariaceae sp.]|jgi:DNA-directed RNA polymerase sigma subunit (sigma70/sigma32)